MRLSEYNCTLALTFDHVILRIVNLWARAVLVHPSVTVLRQFLIRNGALSLYSGMRIGL